MNPSQKERLPLRLEKLYREIGELMMEDVVRRIKKTGKITSTADYQINRLVLLGATSEEIEKEIQKRTELALAEMYEMYDNVINWEYVRSKDIYEQINSEFIPWEENYQLQQISKALIEQSESELKNLTQSMGFAIEMNGKTVFTPLSEYYQKYLDQMLLGIVTGAFDYNSALRKCITQMTNSGIRTVDYATGHSNRIEVAARRAVMTGITQLTGKISDYNAQRLGTEYFEVAWHSGARNTGSGYLNHQSWQGKVYTRQQLIEVCGLGLGGGLEGWNCYHERYPFFLGISERNWTDEWLDAKNQEENTPKTYNGKKYTTYQATQKQRQMETAMRAQRERVQLLQKGKADAETIMDARIKYQLQLDEYGRFSRKMGLVQQRERIYLDMKGRVAPSIESMQSRLQKKKNAESAVKSVARAGKDDIIKVDAKPGSAKYREEKRKKIVEYCVSQKRPIFATDDFGDYVSNVPVKKGFYDVALHGAPKYAKAFGEHVNADTLAEIIRNRKDFDGKSSIRLLSCSTGKGEACFAQVLANKLNVPVEAPNDIIWVRPDGTYTVGPSKYKNTGKMITFYPEGK